MTGRVHQVARVAEPDPLRVNVVDPVAADNKPFRLADPDVSPRLSLPRNFEALDDDTRLPQQSRSRRRLSGHGEGNKHHAAGDRLSGGFHDDESGRCPLPYDSHRGLLQT